MAKKSIAFTHRKLVREWHPTKNGDLRPTDVTRGMHRLVWWKCSAGPDHEWRAPVYSRTSGNGCPFCAGTRTSRSKSLAAQRNTTARRLVREWDRSKNELTPRAVLPGSNRRVHWRCRKGHEWDATIANRYKTDAKCPYCTGARLTAERSLAVQFPEVAAEWHPTLNGKRKPTEIRGRTNDPAWFQCPDHHEHAYEMRVRFRTVLGSRCPFCSGRRLHRTNSLARLNPELATEWHPTKNGRLRPQDVRPGSGKRIWWRCGRGHRWQTSVANRKRTGCPVCAGRRSGPMRMIADHPRLFAEWHPTKNRGLDPSTMSVRSTTSVWWRCAKDSTHEWTSDPRQRFSKRLGCQFCRGRRASRDHNLAKMHPELARQWHPTKNGELRPRDVLAGSGRGVWWRCRKGHEWRASVCNRARKPHPTGCPYCSNKKVGKDNSLAFLRPELAKQWDRKRNELSPRDVTPGSNKRVWWKCRRGPDHEWETTVANRGRRRDGCPFCLNRRASVTNSLARHERELAKQWHPTKNGDLSPHDLPRGSGHSVWWKCPEGDDHEWEAKVDTRVRYPRCPYCVGARVTFIDSLAGRFSKIAAQWHPTKNGKLTPERLMAASNKQVWWRCPRKHVYALSVRHRTVGFRGCPTCTPGEQVERT